MLQLKYSINETHKKYIDWNKKQAMFLDRTDNIPLPPLQFSDSELSSWAMELEAIYSKILSNESS